MKLRQPSAQIACLAVLGWTAGAWGVAPSALKTTYWRFEEGTAGQPVPYGNDTILDSSGNNQHSHCHEKPDEAPISYHPTWSTEVPVNRILRDTGYPSTLSLRFDLWFYGAELLGNDIWTALKDINNPVFTDITIEAAFKADAIAPEGRFQGIIVKNGQATPQGHPPLVLKIRGDNGRLQIETVDNSLQVRSVESLQPLVAGEWYYAAAVGTATELKLYLDSGDGAGYVLQGTTPVTGRPDGPALHRRTRRMERLLAGLPVLEVGEQLGRGARLLEQSQRGLVRRLD